MDKNGAFQSIMVKGDVGMGSRIFQHAFAFFVQWFKSRFLQAGDMIEVAFKEARSGGDEVGGKSWDTLQRSIASGDVKRATENGHSEFSHMGKW